ncbi:MAG: DUF561 domain-containing protein [Bacteroidota bacterium]
MWYKTRVTELLGIQYPIVQGPFGGGYSSAELVAAVSNLGGMGGYGANGMQPKDILAINTDIRQRTDKPYVINLWVDQVDEQDEFDAAHFAKLTDAYRPLFTELGVPIPERPATRENIFDQQLEAVLEASPPAFSFIFGIPSAEALRACRQRGILTIGNATTVDEAIALEEAGVDLIVASGFEAGGHRPSFLRKSEESLTGTFALIPQIASQVHTPIVAAGGVADARGVAAALLLGASAVQVGTAFLACQASNASDVHRSVLFSERAKYTTLTRHFTGRLARGTASGIARTGEKEDRLIAPYPLHSSFLGPLRRAALEQGRTDLITFWAGQNAPLIRHDKVAAVMNSLIQDVDVLLQTLLAGV